MLRCTRCDCLYWITKVGETFDKGETFGAVESVKSASDFIYAVSGKVIAVNEELTNSPELVNEDPYKNFFYWNWSFWWEMN